MVLITVPAPDTKIVSESGILLLSTTNVPLLTKWAGSLVVGKKLRTEIVPYSPPRSNPQNSLFHALVGEIARVSYMDAALVKEGLKEQYCPKMSVLFGNREALVPKPTHLLSVSEMRDLIESTIMEAVEAGVDVTPFLADYREN